MARLKCPNCNYVFSRKALTFFNVTGIGGLWPFVLRVHAECQTANGRDGLKSLSLGVKVKKKLLMMRLTEVTI